MINSFIKKAAYLFLCLLFVTLQASAGLSEDLKRAIQTDLEMAKRVFEAKLGAGVNFSTIENKRLIFRIFLKSYLFPNEIAPDVGLEVAIDAARALGENSPFRFQNPTDRRLVVTTGSERAWYLATACPFYLNKEEVVTDFLLVDYGVAAAYNAVNKLLIAISKNLDHYSFLRFDATLEDWMDACSAEGLLIERDNLLLLFLFWSTVLDEQTRASVAVLRGWENRELFYHTEGVFRFNYLFDAAVFNRIQQVIRENRLHVCHTNILNVNDALIQEIVGEGVQIALLDLSNIVEPMTAPTTGDNPSPVDALSAGCLRSNYVDMDHFLRVMDHLQNTVGHPNCLFASTFNHQPRWLSGLTLELFELQLEINGKELRLLPSCCPVKKILSMRNSCTDKRSKKQQASIRSFVLCEDQQQLPGFCWLSREDHRARVTRRLAMQEEVRVCPGMIRQGRSRLGRMDEALTLYRLRLRELEEGVVVTIPVQVGVVETAAPVEEVQATPDRNGRLTGNPTSQ